MDELFIGSEVLLDLIGEDLISEGLADSRSPVKMDDTVATMTVVVDGQTYLVTVRAQ